MRKIATAVVSAGLVAGVGLGASLTGAGAAPAPKVTICHGTGSSSNPYVKITVSQNSFKNGHFHNGIEPGHGPGHADNPDYLIDSDGTCGETPATTTSGGTVPPPTTLPDDDTTTTHPDE